MMSSKNIETIAEVHERVSKTGNPEEVDGLYKLRDAEVARLGAMAVIEIEDVANLDRIGQFSVACQFFGQCTAPSQQLLLNGHPHTAAAANISLEKLNNSAINA
jgi:hypothetical protein